MTLAQTIHDAMLRHMDAGNVVMGQNVAEGLGGTIPTEHKNLLTLPTSDCSNAGVAVGHAIAGRHPVLVLRFQGLVKVGLWPVLEYAGKSKALWGVPCPIFVRAVAREGLLGPVCSGAQHGLAMRCPGVKVVAPMTPSEWSDCWQEFLDGDDPVYCSEQMSSYGMQAGEWGWSVGIFSPILVGIGKARESLAKAAEKLVTPCFSVHKLKPLDLSGVPHCPVRPSKPYLVVDCEPQTCGAAEHVAMELHRLTGAKVRTLALADEVATFSPERDVLTPSVERIVRAVKELENE